jgi:hypothetical protein
MEFSAIMKCLSPSLPPIIHQWPSPSWWSDREVQKYLENVIILEFMELRLFWDSIIFCGSQAA